MVWYYEHMTQYGGNDVSYCRGGKEWLDVTELEGKAWHDNDLYLVKCKKCGAIETCLARRPREVIVKCEDVDDAR